MSATLFDRRSIRLRGYDYTHEGAYFVTVCTEGRKRLFGTIVNGHMVLNDAGRMVQDVWAELPSHYPGVAIDAFIVMPDHIHGIVRLVSVGAGPRACPDPSTIPAANGQAQGPAPTEPDARPMSLPDVIHRIKSLTTKRYIDGVSSSGWHRFAGTLWQRNYYDIIVRTEISLDRIRAYIRNNPANCDVLRYGEPRFMVGNRALLNSQKTAFLASRPQGQVSALPVFPTAPACVISGFLSPQERAVFDACLADGTPMIQVLASGLPDAFPSPIQLAIDRDRLLVMTPFPKTEHLINATRAAWCNQYVLDAADTVVIGHLNPDGMLACLLSDLPHGKPVLRL